MSSTSNTSSGGGFSDIGLHSMLWEPPADYDSVPDQWDNIPRRRATFSPPERDKQEEEGHSDDSEGNPKTFKRVCQRFAERTSMQGIPYVYVSSAKYAKFFWVVIFLIGCGCMVAHLWLLFSDYYSYETQTQVDLGFSPLAFPAVTFCNVNRIRSTKVTMASERLQALIEEIQPSNIALAMEDKRKESDGPSDTRESAPGDQQMTQAAPGPTAPAQPADSVQTTGAQADVSNSPEPPKSSTQAPQTTKSSSSAPTSTGSSQTTKSSTSAQSSQTTKSSTSAQSSQTTKSSTSTETQSAQTTKSQTSTSAPQTTTSPVSTTSQTTSQTSTASAGNPQTPATSKSTSTQASGLPAGGTQSGSGTTPASGSNQDSGSKSNQPPQQPAPGRRRRKKRSSFGEELGELHHRVKRFITGFEVNETSSRYQPTDAAKQLNVYSGTKTTTRKIEDEFKTLYSFEDRDTRVNMGHQIEDMLISCSFSGIECYATDFNMIMTSEYGNCYTIESDRFLSITGGPSDGLELILYLQNSEYLGGVTTSQASIQVVVHEPSSIPFPYRKGFAVSTATESYIGLRQVNLFRESKPYGSCQDNDDALSAAGIKYTRTACQLVCIQQETLSRCGCYDANQDELHRRTAANVSEIKYCESDEEIECMTRVESNFTGGTLGCVCNSPCSETDYTQAYSFRLWPSEDYASVLAETLCSLNASLCDSFLAQDAESLRANFIKVIIYFEDLNYEDITEQPDYPDTQFISDVGGTIGLWIGLSIISFFEVLQFLYEMLHYVLYVKPRQHAKARRKARKKKLERAVNKSINVRKAVTSPHSVGFSALDSMRQVSTMDSPKNIYSVQI